MSEAVDDLLVVYVRLCGEDSADDCREMRFRLPSDIEQRDLLAAGFAIDGNMATKAIVRYGDDTMSDALRRAQLELLEWLAAHGHAEVEFR